MAARPARWRVREALLAYALIAPALVILGMFAIVPIFYSVYISLFQHTGYVRGAFIGPANYAHALTARAFWNSVLVTVYYAAGTIPVSMAISFLVASALFRIVRGRSLFRTIYFLPYVTSVVAAATIWRVLLNPQFGFVNGVFRWLGLPKTPWSQWLLEWRGVLHLLTGGLVPEQIGPSLALCCIMVFDIWHACGFMIVVFLAGLTAIPRELEESARIDGAGWFQVTRRITLPLLSPTVFFLAVVSAVKAFQAFNSFFALTNRGSGPQGTTESLTVYIYACFYESGNEGYGAAVAALLSLAIMALTVVQWRVVGRKVYYD